MKSKYDKIINPKTGRLVNVNGNLGKKIINRYLLELNGGERKSKRLRKIEPIRTVSTKSAATARHSKKKDDYTDLLDKIKNAEIHLQETGTVKFSLVWPDNHYKKKFINYPHQGHTFLMSRNKNTLIVYDNSHDKKYYNKYEDNEKIWDDNIVKNYQVVIDKLRGSRNLIFFPTLLFGEYKIAIGQDEGGCVDYADLLIDNQVIKIPPLKDFVIDSKYKYNASKNEINKL